MADQLPTEPEDWATKPYTIKEGQTARVTVTLEYPDEAIGQSVTFELSPGTVMHASYDLREPVADRLMCNFALQLTTARIVSRKVIIT